MKHDSQFQLDKRAVSSQHPNNNCLSQRTARPLVTFDLFVKQKRMVRWMGCGRKEPRNQLKQSRFSAVALD